MKKQKSKSFVFAEEWLPAIEAVEDREEQLKLWQHVAHYGLHGEEKPELSVPLRPVAMLIRTAIDRAQEKYEEVCERRRAAAEGRWRASNGMQKDAKDASAYDGMQNDANSSDGTDANAQTKMQKDAKDANAPEKGGANASNGMQKDAKNANAHFAMHNDNDNEHDNDNDNEHDNDGSSNKFSEPIKSPQSPPGGGDGGEKGFWDFFERVRETVIPAAVEERQWETQYRWRAADGMKEYCDRVAWGIGVKKLSGLVLDDYMRALHQMFEPRTPFKAYRLAEALLPLDAATAAAVCSEADRAADEPDIWDTLLEKVAYIKTEGKTINNIFAFLRNRKASKAASGTKKKA